MVDLKHQNAIICFTRGYLSETLGSLHSGTIGLTVL